MYLFQIGSSAWLMFLVLFNASVFQPPSNELKEKVEQDYINQIDQQGRKQGLWVIYQPKRMGEAAYYQQGHYENDLRMGTWYTFDEYSNIIGIEHFAYDQLNGTVKYFDQNGLVVEGQYYGKSKLVAIDSIIVTHPLTFMDTIVAVNEEIGSFKHGVWNYYNSDLGRLIKREYYQVGTVVKYEEVPLIEIMDSTVYKERVNQLPHNQPAPTKKIRSRSSLIE